jgi:hypothetical protein
MESERVFRSDAGGGLRPARRMDDGRIVVDAYLTRTGVFRYTNKDGSTRLELRHHEDVFDPESMRSFANLPVTNRHPPGLINARTARKYVVGASGDSVSREGENMRGTLAVFDAETVAEMDAGELVEVSNGYSCRLDRTPGVDPIYGEYHVRQRDIRGNHVALVPQGRAGTSRVRMDAEDADPTLVGERVEKTDEGATLARDRVAPLGARVTLARMTDEEARALNAKLKTTEAALSTVEANLETATKRADAAEGKLEIANKKIEEQVATLAAGSQALETDAVKKAQERADAAEGSRAALESSFPKAVRARAKLERISEAVMGPKFRMDDLNDHQVRVEVVKRLDSTKDCKEASPGKVEGWFESLTEDYVAKIRARVDASETLAGVTGAHRADVAADKAEDKPRTRRDLWKEPLPNAAAQERAEG